MLKKYLNPNKRVFSLFLCIISAFAMWVYVSYVENPQITRSVKHIALSVNGEDALNLKGLAVKSVSDDYISLTLNTKRSNYRHLSPEQILASIDVSTISSVGEHTLNVSVSFPSSTSNVSVSDNNLTIDVVIEKYITQEFEIVPKLSGKMPSGYSVREMLIDSSSPTVSVSGSESIVSTIEQVATSPIDISDITDDFQKQITIQALDKHGKNVSNVKFSLDSPITADFVVYRTELFPLELNISRDNPDTLTFCETNAVKITGPSSTITKWIEEGKVIRTTPIDEYLYQTLSDARIALPALPDSFEYVGEDATEIMVTFEHTEHTHQ